MQDLIISLTKKLYSFFLQFLQVLLIAVLGVLVGIFFILPWLFRFFALFVWLYGGYLIVIDIARIYGGFTPEIPVYALQVFAVIAQLVLILVVLLFDKRLVWGALYAAGGIPIWLVLVGIPSAYENWKDAEMVFSLLPSLSWAVLLVYITIKTKAKRAGRPFFSFDIKGFFDPALDTVDALLSPQGGDHE